MADILILTQKATIGATMLVPIQTEMTHIIDANRADHYPQLTPFDLASLAIQLPSWANLTSPEPLTISSSTPQTQPTSTTASPSPSSTINPTQSAIPNSTQLQQPSSQQGTQQAQPTQSEKPQPLPSPFIIAALIIVVVAVFGTILSLCLRKRGRNLTQ